MRRAIGMIVAMAALLVIQTGCLEIEEVIQINKDLSGTSAIAVSIDMKAMLGPLLMLGGDDMNVEEIMAEAADEQQGEMREKLAELEAALPAGIALVGSDLAREGSRMVTRLILSFDDIETFARFRQDSEAMSSLSDDDGPGQSPLGPMRVVRTDDRLELQFESVADDADLTPPDDADPEMAAMVQSMFSGQMKVSLHIEAPWAVVEHNGSGQHNERTSWEYDVMQLSQTPAEERDKLAPRIVFDLNAETQMGASPAVAAIAAAPAVAGTVGHAPPALAGKEEMAFARLPGGRVVIDGRAVTVAPFEMAITEVTQRQWRKVTKSKPFDCKVGCGKTLPAQGMTWADAARFMNALSEREGRTTCYAIDGDKVVMSRAQSCTGYRMPTEAEWEHAVRAGTTTPFHWDRRTTRSTCSRGTPATAAARCIPSAPRRRIPGV